MIRAWLPGLISILVALSGCDAGGNRAQLELSGSTMGTTFNVKLPSPPRQLSLDQLQDAIGKRLEQIENLASTYLDNSELSGFNRSDSTDWFPVSGELCRAVEETLAISRKTDGAFDVTVGPAVNLWGFGPGEVVFQPPSSSEISNALSLIGYDNLETDCGSPAIRKHIASLYVDLSAWAKGYAVDQVATLLDAYSLTDYLVEIGGELRLRGENAEHQEWAIAIEEPLAPGRGVQTVVRITNSAVATSGDYRNYFDHDGKRYSHAIDPRSGRPADHDLASVTVLDASCATADAMATALLILGPQAGPALAESQGIAALFLLRGVDGIQQLSTTAYDAMIDR